MEKNSFTVTGTNINFKNTQEYKNNISKSITNPNEYWNEIAKTITWFKPYTTISDYSFNKNNVYIKWFTEGTTNIAYNCINANLQAHANKVAFIFVNNGITKTTSITYSELHVNVNKYSNMLINIGVKKGDVVTIYMPISQEAIYTILACANIGATHSVVFTGFAATAIAERINDANSKFLITTSNAFRGAKNINIKSIIDSVIPLCPQLKKVVINNNNNADLSNYNNLYIDLSVLLANCIDTFTPVEMNAEDPLFILYTSGSTAKPKGLVHTVGGYSVYAKHTFKINFNYSLNDVYFCTADIGWITGHSYVIYGPLLNAATTVIYEGLPLYPDASSYWKICEQLKVNIFYTSPTALRSLLGHDSNKYVKPYNLSSLKILGTVGEPINLEAWEWFFNVVGNKKCFIVDTWWQTETGGHIINSVPYVTQHKPTKAGKTFFGINAVILNDNQQIVANNTDGALCLSTSWPGQARTIINNHDLFVKTYFSAYPGYYFSGDEANIDDDGDIRILGRKDDVINVSGHRMSSANLEDVVNMHPLIAESAAIGVEDSIKGFDILIFCSLNKNAITHTNITNEKIIAEAIELLRTKIGPIATPKGVIITPDLPKTRSGKIMRRILRKIGNNDYSNFGDTSTLVNPEIVEIIVNVVKNK